jgi:F-type H+-transporting ATPase subunit delta
MTNRAAAHRYARALFDVALRERADLDAIDRDLAEFAALFDGHATLRDVMLNPAVPAPRKHAAMEALLARTEVPSILRKLLLMLAERDRLVLLPDIREAYRERLMDHQQVVRAEVTTAEPLPAERLTAIERRLAALTSRRVLMTAQTDPRIIGGVVARIGSTVYDGSVAMQLNRLKERLKDGG